MAMIIYDIISKYGIPVTYWRIEKINYDTKLELCEITLQGYASKKTFDSNSVALETKLYSASGEDYKNLFSDIALREAIKENKTLFDIAYEFIKSIDSDFAKAMDRYNCVGAECNYSCMDCPTPYKERK